MEEPTLDIPEAVEEDNSWVNRILCLRPRSSPKFLTALVLPPGSKILSISPYGASFWTRTGRIDVRTPSNGEEGLERDQSFFIKLATFDHGLTMVKGEYLSQQALYTISPAMVPLPIGYGTYESNPDLHFFLCEFIELIDELPEMGDFCEKLADLHRRSMTMSSNGMFGFSEITCNGKVPQDNTWNTSWESFFIRSLQHEFMLEEQVHGPSDDIQSLTPILYEKVCPRLLRPLETEGRSLKPSLIHGSLRGGFIGVGAKSGQPVIFAASSFWAHNEYDLAIWRGSRYRMRSYIKEYFKHFPCSPPTQDWDDRNLLYSIRADLHDSIMYPGTLRFRDLVIVSLKQLTKKFTAGYQGRFQRKGSASDLPAVPSTNQRETPSDIGQPAPESSEISEQPVWNDTKEAHLLPDISHRD